MSDIIRLKKNIDFTNVYKKGKSMADKYVVLYTYKNSEPYARVGFTASKKVGKSVDRNRARRLMKESFRKNQNYVQAGFDLVFIARAAIKDSSYEDVERSLRRVMKKSGIFNKK